MVRGIDTFKEFFKGFEDNYVIIGGMQWFRISPAWENSKIFGYRVYKISCYAQEIEI